MAARITLANGCMYTVEVSSEVSYRDVTQRAASLGNNVGVDEFTEDTITALLAVSDVYTVSKSADGDVIGLLILQPSPYSRRLLPLVGYFHVILAEGSMDESRELYGHLGGVMCQTDHRQG